MLLARGMLEQTGFIASGRQCSLHMQRVASNAIALDGNAWRESKHSSRSVCSFSSS